jgi:hypothetical protein
MSWEEEQMIEVVLGAGRRQPLADALELAQRLRVRLLAQLEGLEQPDGAAVALSGAGALAQCCLGVSERTE